VKTRITLQLIADEAGLSKFAVSRALSGKRGVSEGTRKRVTEIARRLGYSRTPQQAEKPIGVIFDDTDVVNSELHMQVQSGVQREAQRLGVAVRTYWTHEPDDIETIAGNSSGLIIAGPHNEKSLRRAYETGIPIVRRGWIDPLEPVDQVSGTDNEAGAAVAQFLIGLGHREIIYVHGLAGLRGRIERFHGMRNVIEAAGDIVLHDLVWSENGSFTEALNAAFPNEFAATAFFCSHDGLAVTVISELLSWGYRIPQDVSVVGFGDYSAARQILPALTTVKTPGQELGAMAVRVVMDRLRSRHTPSHSLRVQVPNRLVIRDSTGPASQEVGSGRGDVTGRPLVASVNGLEPPR
jgi:LacI family transcriptional regulator